MIIRNAVICLSLAACLAPRAIAADADAGPSAAQMQAMQAAMQKFMSSYNQALQQGGYLAGINASQEVLADPKASVWLKDAARQRLGTDQSLVGETRAAIATFDQRESPDAVKPAIMPKGYHPVSLAKQIADLAHGHRVVMINEAHHVPQTRATTLQILEPLHAAGFRYLALEAVHSNDAEIINRTGRVPAIRGDYTNEPTYAAMVRRAVALGYTIISYDVSAGGAQREEQAGKHLADFLKAHPGSRMLVHAGYGHIREGKFHTRDYLATAQVLANLTGLDPLTLDQTETFAHSKPAYESPVYRGVTKTADLRSPSLLINADGKLWHPADKPVDAAVFLPRPKMVRGRPDWLARLPGREPLQIAKDVCQHGPCLIELVDRFAPRTTPIDRVLMHENHPVTLYAPAGAYTLRIRSSDADSPRERTINVPAQ